LKVLYVKDTDNVYIYENGRIVKGAKEKGVITSSLRYKEIYTFSFKLPKDIDKNMLEMEAEKYLYEEGSLDFSKDYKINFIFEEKEDEYFVEAFAVEVERLQNVFKNIVEEYKYIDFISPNFLAFKSYYDIKEETPSGVDMFIYFDEEDAFVSCFSNGNFVFVKTILKFSVLEKEFGDKNYLIKLLKEKGLNRSLYENEEEYQKIESFFTQFFGRLSSVITYSLNNYQLPKVDRLFFYSPFEIHSLISTYKEFWNLSGVDFQQYEIPSDYDAFDYTITHFNAKNYNNEEINFSVFKRPEPFYKKEIGKFVIFTAVVFGLIFADAVYRYIKIFKVENEVQELRQKFKDNKAIVNKLEKEYRSLNIEIKDLRKKLAQLNKKVDKYKSLVDELYDENCKKIFLKDYYLISNLIAKYKLQVVFFNKKGNDYIIKIKSPYYNSDKIALFMKDLVKNGFKKVDVKVIVNNNDTYYSIVRFSNDG